MKNALKFTFRYVFSSIEGLEGIAVFNTYDDKESHREAKYPHHQYYSSR